MAIRSRFKTLSQQKAAHAQQISFSIHVESFSSTPKLSKGKKGCASKGKVEEVPRNCVAHETMQKKCMFSMSFTVHISELGDHVM